MKTRFLILSAVRCVLLLGVVVVAGRLVERTAGGALDLGGARPGTLDAETRYALARMDGPLAISYFVSTRERMPSRFQRLEDDVRALLAALEKAALQKVHCRVLYPEISGAQGIAYAAGKGVSAFSVGQVRHDEHDERKIWSSLVLEHGQRRPVLINSVQPVHVQQLEALIREHVEALHRPPRPVFAVAAARGCRSLKRALAEYGEVVSLDLARDPRIPREADVLFWVQPRAGTPAHRRALADFVASGRSAVLAGSSYGTEYLASDGDLLFRFQRYGSAWSDLLRPLGIKPIPDLLLDRSGPLSVRGRGGRVRELDAPFHLRCLPAQCDFRPLAGPARGGLAFRAASALELDAVRVREAGYRPEVLATTTGAARAMALRHEPLPATALEGGQPVGRRNLMVLLTSTDPLAGRILVLGSSSPFQDVIFEQPGYAHAAFLRTLVRTFAAPEALAQARADKRQPPALSPPGQGQRVLWRLLTVAAVPLAFLVVGMGRLLQAERGGPVRAVLRFGGWVAAGVCGLAAMGHAVSLTAAPRWDMTRGRLNEPSPVLREQLATRAGKLRVELHVSPRAERPRGLKQVESRLRSVLDPAGVQLAVSHPEHASAAVRAQLARAGLTPLPVEQVRHDSVFTRQVWCGLRLRQNERVAVIPHLDERALRHLDFLVAAALQRLERSDWPRVELIAEPPRLSPAEAMEDYHRRSLIPPAGTDVYSQLKRLLTDYGYRVAYVDPRKPRFVADADLLLWLQPRRDCTSIIAHLAQHLHQGGNAMVAVQHFNIQQRQYRGLGFQTVYWPQPQFPDLNPYLAQLGVTQVREVLMDRTRSHAVLETQVNRSAVREYDPQKVALPFLIRGVAAHYSGSSPITRRLGDLLFIWANRFTLEPERMRHMGLAADTLITTSADSWSYDWSGGWLPPEAFSATEPLHGPQPLLLDVRGRFPAVTANTDDTGRPRWTAVPSTPAVETGRLILSGCAQMFTDQRLFAAGFDHDQLLLNCVAALTYGPELAELQARSTAPRGFAPPPAEAKALWRLFAIGGGPLAFGLIALARLAARRRGRR